MFRKYEKTYRIVSEKIRVAGKLNLSYEDQRALLKGHSILIEEKMDGANTAIIRGKGDKWTLQKRRGLADTHAHEQFAFFWNWARANEEKILQIPEGWIVYGELMYATHHIFYDELPDYWLAFDVWNEKDGYLGPSKFDYIERWGFQRVPILHIGILDNVNIDRLVYDTSSYASKSVREGIVIKNFRNGLRGKLVRPEFMKEIEEDDHWMKRSVRRNQLRG